MSNSTPVNGLRFAPFSSSVDIAFWHEFTKRKLELYKLSGEPVELQGSYTHNDDKVPTPRLSVIYSAFNRSVSSGITCPGLLVHTNTIDEFRKCDRKELLSRVAEEQLWQPIVSGRAIEEPSLLGFFLMHLFGDLKKYRYLYWFAFPVYTGYSETLVEPVQSLADLWTEEQTSSLLSSYHNRAAGVDAGFCVVEQTTDVAFVCHPLTEYDALTQAGAKVFLCMADPSSIPGVPGWPLRNLLSLAYIHWKAQRVHSVICLREVARGGQRCAGSSLLIKVSLAARAGSDLADAASAAPPCLGWEKDKAGKLAPICLDLSKSMDPTKISDAACSLTLQLMRWRVAPELDIPKMEATRCLLFGAGTLGCNVARTLLGWGITRITFVDSGRVSYSNPVRQSLYTFADCHNGGKHKAPAAAEALKLIRPSVDSRGVVLQIPMPGHPPGQQQLEETKRAVEQVQQLIAEHDAVFLLTDSSESRWLPSVIGASQKKIMITAAVGFESFQVIRHGYKSHRAAAKGADAGGGEGSGKAVPIDYFSKVVPGWHLGCFFCQDVGVPADTQTDRTLDQQCTVSRPGISLMAAAEAVELLASMLQHPNGPEASSCHDSTNEGVLGTVPHSVRYHIAVRKFFTPTTPVFAHCLACSETVLSQYERDGWSMLLKVFNDSNALAELTGLNDLFKGTDEGPAIDDFSASDWDDDVSDI